MPRFLAVEIGDDADRTPYVIDVEPPGGGGTWVCLAKTTFWADAIAQALNVHTPQEATGT